MTVTLANWAVQTGLGGFAHYYGDLSTPDDPHAIMGEGDNVGPMGFRILTQAETTTVRWDPANGIGV